MLSYRHEFHAGNHADVLKHLTLCELLRYLTLKGKGLWYVDTHAGKGQYLFDGHAVARTEAADGIARLWSQEGLPAATQRYVDLVHRVNPNGLLGFYPGSPVLAAMLLRSEDRLWLSELHPADFRGLVNTFGTRDRRVRIEQRDGLEWLRALLPPAPRRALVMIDPSYEVKAEYGKVVAALSDAIAQFPTGVYAVWYPILRRREAEEFPSMLVQAAGDRWLHATLRVRHPTATGMYGSGMFIVNPPYTLPGVLAENLPALADLLAQDAGAGHSVEFRIP